MYKTVLHALVFFFLVLCGLGCTSSPMPDSHNEDGDDNHQGRVLSEGIVLKEGVFYFGGDDQQYISVLDTNKIAVKANIPSQMKFGIGDVVLVDFSQKAPLGFAGKVISQKEESGEAVFYTKPVSLEEIYEELSIDSDIDVYKDADSVVDDEGQVYELAPVEDSDIAQMTEGGDDPVKGLTDKDFTSFKSIPIESTYFNGRLFVCSHAHVKINITKGKVEEYDILLERQSYLASRIGVELSGTIEFPILREKNFSLPVGIPVCPGVVLEPILSVSVDFSAEGALRLQSNVYVKFEDTSVRFHNGKYTNNSTNTPVFKLTPAYLDCEASAEIEPRVALKFDVWGLKLIGFGVDVKSSFKFTLSGSMKMSEKKQLKKDVKANVEIGGSIGLFCYAKFLKGNDLRAAISFPSLSYEVDLLDKGKNHTIKKEVGEWSVTGEFGEEEVFLDVKKSGYALFRIGEEEPLEKAFLEDMTVVKTTSGERGFKVPDNPLDYYVRTLNILKDESGKEYQFFGQLVGDFIKSISVQYGTDYHCTLPFEYDEFGRLVSAGSYRYSYAESSLIITGGRYGFPVEDTLMPQEWHISLDSNGTIAGGSYSSGKSTELSITSGCSSYRFPESDYEHYVDFSWENNTLTQIHEHGEIPMSEGKVDIFDHYYDYSYGSYRNSLGTTDLSNYIMDMQIPPFVLIPGIVSEFLPTGYTFTQKYSSGYTSKETIGFSYTLDDVGRIHSFKTRQYSGTITYKDTDADDGETRL